MRKYLMPTLFALLIGTTSCSIDVNGKDGNSITSFGNVNASNSLVSETRNVGKFEGLSVSSAIDVKITNNPSNGEITITASDNVIKLVKAEIKDQILTISLDKNVNFNKNKVEINIPHQKLRHIKVSGASSVEANHVMKVEKFSVIASGASDLDLNLMTNHIDLDLSGASDVDLKGNVQDFNLEVSGASELNSKELKAANVIVNASGASSVYVWAVNQLKVEASGASSVFYRNSTGLIKNVSSTGSSDVEVFN